MRIRPYQVALPTPILLMIFAAIGNTVKTPRDKKKMAMTSEARISAKIVAVIPLAFCGLLSVISPDKLDFILYDPDGRGILYYVVGSEFLGLAVIWLLMKGVR